MKLGTKRRTAAAKSMISVKKKQTDVGTSSLNPPDLKRPRVGKATKATASTVTQAFNTAPNLRLDHQMTVDSVVNEDLTSKLKPIIIESTYSVVKRIIAETEISKETTIRLNKHNVNKLSVTCVNLEDKTKLLDSLLKAKIQFFTYSEKADKPTIFLLRGIDEMSCEEISSVLEAANKKPSKVSFFLKKTETRRPVFLIQFPKGVTELKEIQHSIKRIDGLSASWEYFRHDKRHTTQCFRCQSWGHSNRHCNRIPRCNKCGDNHLFSECPRERNSTEIQPKCCNCGEQHVANFRGCKALTKYEERKFSAKRAPLPQPAHFAPQIGNAWEQRQQSQQPELDRYQPPSQLTQPQRPTSRPYIYTQRQKLSRPPQALNAYQRNPQLFNPDEFPNLTGHPHSKQRNHRQPTNDRETSRSSREHPEMDWNQVSSLENSSLSQSFNELQVKFLAQQEMLSEMSKQLTSLTALMNHLIAASPLLGPIAADFITPNQTLFKPNTDNEY